MAFRVCTYNIRFVLDRWNEREALLERTIGDVNADVYGFQEVLIGGNRVGQQLSICSTLNREKTKNFRSYDSPGARLYFDCLPDWISYFFKSTLANIFYDMCAIFNLYLLSAIVGKYVQLIYHNAILKIISFIGLGTAFVFGTTLIVNKKIVDADADDVIHDIIRIGGWRGAHSVQFKINGKQILIVNLHLSSARNEEVVRCAEMKQVCEWIESKEIDGGVIVMGDFNAQPDGLCYSYLINRGYTSAYKACHGNEPMMTFHQSHECSTKDVDEECTLDYIMFKGKALQLSGEGKSDVVLIGTESCEKDPTLYPSDHFGVAANFSLKA